jgi:hypothetical protein
MLHASASNGLSDIETHIENAPCNRPFRKIHCDAREREREGSRSSFTTRVLTAVVIAILLGAVRMVVAGLIYTVIF